jgi:PKD repeat protein
MRWRLAIGLILSAATLNGCSCEDPPRPIVHVSPSGTVRVGDVVTFDSRQAPGEPDPNIESDAQTGWDLDGDGRFDITGKRVVQRSFDAPGSHEVTFVAGNSVVNTLLGGEIQVYGYDTKVVTVAEPSGTPPANKPPTASFTASPNPGYTEYRINFDASASSDSDGSIVSYEWDWTDDGTFDESHDSPDAVHLYDSSGTYTVALRVTDNEGATAIYRATIQIMDGLPPGKVLAREGAGVSAAAAGSPFTLEASKVKLTPGTTTVTGSKLLTAGIRATGRLHFKRAPRLLGTHRSPRWVGSLALLQKGSGLKAKLSGQGYVLLAFSKKDRLCLGGTASASLSGAGFKGRLAVAGGSGLGARLRGTGTFAPQAARAGSRVVKGRLKLRQVRKRRALPTACRSLARDLR